MKVFPSHDNLAREITYFTGQYSVFVAFLEQGDEVIMFEPFFDQYLPSITFNGGKPVYVPLHPPKGSIKKPTSDDWTIDVEEVR
jgi:kynurenine aminotransferase